MNAAGTTPTRVSVRMYQVGFGDCFLLGFHYPAALEDGRRDRYLLIDFGSTRWPKGHPGRYREIAADIQERTGGRLDAIVITHRHKDHISGYGNNTAADVIAALQPCFVLRPWTENPAAATDATGPALLGEGSLQYARGIGKAQMFAEQVGNVIDSKARGYRADLRDLASDQVPNHEAVTRLDQLAAETPSGGTYAVAGTTAGLEELLPGVQTTVLGPPTIEQWPQMTGEREDDPEYWLRQQTFLERMLAAADAPPKIQRVAAAADASNIDPGPIRWIVEKLHDQQTHSLLRIVRTLDDALNSTSVILLFQVGTRALLFPGDAQIENWSYALTAPQAEPLRADLGTISLYKVGHHGSRNASPRSLVKQWQERIAPQLTSVMSTMPGVHGESDATAVPRTTLVEALILLGPCYRSDAFPPEQVAQEIDASTTDDAPFQPVPDSNGL